MKNWKTTIAGIGSIGLGVHLLTNHQYEEGIAAISAGIGLLFSKDHNQTGK